VAPADVEASVHSLLHGSSDEWHALALKIFSGGRTNSPYGWVVEPALDCNGIEAAAYILGRAQALETILLAELPFEHRMSRK
jgi:hypothetical protein